MCRFNDDQTDVLGGTKNNGPQDRQILPQWLVPRHYDVWLAPDLETFKFDGTVAIALDVVADTFKAVLHSKNIVIHKAAISVGGSAKQEAVSIEFDTDLETVTFTFGELITAGSSAFLEIEFTGAHNDHLHGFYRSTYNDTEGNKKYLVVTQFESTDCRQAFPSYDEPGLKATFSVTLVVDRSLVALSNMNEISSVDFTNSAGKLVKSVTFAKTPVMSTYLVAFVVGDLEYISTVATPAAPADAQPITVRVFTVKGLIDQGEFALEVARRTHVFFSEYFNEAFPLPKSDLVAIPDFAAGAMENWGLVTYRNTALLVNKDSTLNSKKSVAYVVGHELAHQWFGNLVTMAWWNDLWLNEGFATFVGNLAVDYLFPEWDVWTGYITGALSGALGLDALRSSHPIDVPVRSAAEISQIFDAISYMKGSSVIRMLNNFLGGQIFMDGVRSYLQEFKYKNAVTADLWTHLAQSSGLDISSIMHSWTKDSGYPLISIESQAYKTEAKTLTVTLSQSRFLSGGELTGEEDTVTWWVPITVVSHLTGKAEASKHVLSEKVGTITFPYDDASNKFWKLNFGASGLYRVKYTDEQVAQIKNTLQNNLETFSVGDRILFLNDAYSLTNAGLGRINTVLDMINALAIGGESDYNVLIQISSTLYSISSISYLESQEVRDGINALGRRVFSPQAAALGFEYIEGEDYFVALKRGLAIGAAANFGDKQVIEELKSRFEKFISGDKSALHPELRVLTYRTVLANATVETAEHVFSSVLEIYKDEKTNASEKGGALRALGIINSLEHVDRLLNQIIWDQEVVRLQDFTTPLFSVGGDNPNATVVRPLLANWFKNNWEKYASRVSSPGRAGGGVFRLSFQYLIGEHVIADINSWVSGEGLDEAGVSKRIKEVEGFKRAVEQVVESIGTKTKLITRERDNLAAWTTANA
ncbi:Aminopeptidase 2 mitochondrial [Physocladia obscura]|uniref:Aminopeptidase n=1 Tax=Physocladia obscura TaxID=109957 RepID=A0AAD5XFP2_9FUNG|nr:Aminopeptidase 2 mitochondrial [Physocladia obscura]